jgi:hypothetical protein
LQTTIGLGVAARRWPLFQLMRISFDANQGCAPNLGSDLLVLV